MTAGWWRAALGAGREPSSDQEAAICAPPTGRHSVDAGAGTGKTSTLALRALYLVEAGHLRADQIVVVTFTKKAAAEVASRIGDTLDRAVAAGAPFAIAGAGVYCTTIHALAAAILREFAFEFGWAGPPRAVSDGEAYAIFHEAFRALSDGALEVDVSAFPVAEIGLDVLERDLAKLALRLKNHGIAPGQFATRALHQSRVLGEQTWGQLYSLGKGGANRIRPHPKVALTAQERALEADREARNIRVVAALLADFDRRLEQRAAATYGDLIGRATSLLRERPALVRRLRARWRYLLLDESQDTSALQLAFIETLFGRPGEPDAAGMMPVGDARQAIYGFNGADEAVMEQLASAADRTHPLVVNRRSLQEIVDAGHAVLVAAEVVTAATPRLRASAGEGGLACVRIQTFGHAGETVKQHVEHEADAIAAEIARLLADEASTPSEIAILVRRRTHAAAYMRALNLRGISAALDRRSGLFVADEIRDALAWMSLLLDLTDERAAVRVLQSPLGGLNDAAMIALAADKDWLAAFLRADAQDGVDANTRERLDRIRALIVGLLPATALPLMAAMNRIITELPIAASYAQLGETIGAQAIANLRGFEELAGAFALEHPGARLRDFVADAQRRIRYDDDPQEAELDVQGVRVLTIHQAKGLEWPYVFVACSTSHQYGATEPTDRVVNYDLASGAFALKNDIDGRETFRWQMLVDEHDALTGLRREPQARKVAAAREAARVFYVALTRAKRRVYVTAPVPPSTGKGEADYLGVLRRWADALQPGADVGFAPDAIAARSNVSPSGRASNGRRSTDPVADSFARGLPPARPAAGTRVVARQPAPDAPPAVPPLRTRVSYTAISAFQTCPRMARLRYRLLLPDLRPQRPRTADAGPADVAVPANAARLGSLAHRALEIWGRATFEPPTLSVEAAFERAEAEFADATAPECEAARACVRHAAELLARYTLLAVESPFAIPCGGTQVEGVIDLIARDADGRLLVIDYKTGRTEDEHYALQLALYRRVAESRFPGKRVDTAIIRMSPSGAVLTRADAVDRIDLDRAIAAAGSFESDVPRVGRWCDYCAYRASPCMAPLEHGMPDIETGVPTAPREPAR